MKVRGSSRERRKGLDADAAGNDSARRKNETYLNMADDVMLRLRIMFFLHNVSCKIKALENMTFVYSGSCLGEFKHVYTLMNAMFGYGIFRAASVPISEPF